MEKQFWKAIQDNDYEIPEGHTVTSLTPELLNLLGSTDPELRDELGYAILVEWVDHDLYSPDALRQMISDLSANLKVGIGEINTDSVFLRAFSILALALIVYYDNKKSFLNPEEVETILNASLQYLAAESDPRGYVPVKGWAHALAHTSDLLLVLAENRHTDAAQHIRILNGIRDKLIAASNWVYVHGEDDRLSRAILEILRRDTLLEPDLQKWLNSFLEPKNGSWKGAWTEKESTRAYFNIRNFFRSLYLHVVTEDELPRKKEIEQMLLDDIQNLQPY